MILLFTCVTLHELGHSIVAKLYGIPVQEIVLFPLGGVSNITKNPDKPLHDLLISIAGPLVNVVIALVLALILGRVGTVSLLNGQGMLQELETPSLQGMLIWLLAANVTLVIFNMIPAFPLDGGRAFRAILAMFIGYRRATRVASLVGELIAIVIGIYSLISGNFMLALIAVIIYFGASQETATAESKTVLKTLRVGDAYNKHALALMVGDRVNKVVDFLLTSYQPDFAVLQGSNLLGIVTRNDVLRALASSSTDLYVTEIMQRDVLKVDASLTLQEVTEKMQAQNARVAAVYNGTSYLGLIGLEDISEAFTILAFQQRQQQMREQGQVKTPNG
jgi:Zn-dependent protease/CBS domain-containing protein